ncbi:TonB-dependent receptor domain-containing protein [Sphingomonas sp.]|uniref:TonB-dependent receptor domain-containing protein n=1 Tax=Sphingomonas sp. TaxID=28214 RepID=UPI003B00B332
MSNSRPFASLLLFTSALVTPAAALAQTGSSPPSGAGTGGAAGSAGGGASTGQATGQAAPTDAGTPAGAAPQTGGTVSESAAPQEATQEQVDVSVPGGAGAEVVVTGQRDRNVVRTGAQVLTVLSSADIARTGEGDIAGALGRVTGLSVVGNGFVYVRGLGDRYSLALLNGSPLPSPEPLRRVVPLDIFPTNIVSSSLVQKSYSVNYPGEFGGGVINLTTKTAPAEPFLSLGVSGGIDSETTGQLGYTYYGTRTDWTGFGNGGRDLKPALRSFLASGNTIGQLSTADNSAIAAQLVTGRNSVVQRNGDIPANASGLVTGGTSFDALGATFGVIATAGYSSKWRTRDTTQQTANTADLSSRDLDFQRVITDNRVVVNGLIGLNATFGDNKVRLTNVYIRDTLKQARLGTGTQANGNPNATLLQQDTAWYARQLYDLQLVGEFKLAPALSLDLRGGYANTKRNAPDEFSYQYYRSNQTPCGTVATAGCDPYGATFINTLTNGQTGLADVSYSFLDEDLWSGGADLSYRLTSDITATIGYAYSDTERRNERRAFIFRSSNLPQGLSVLRPDILLSQPVIIAGPQLSPSQRYTITLTDNEPNPVFLARLTNHAAYAKITAQFLTDLTLDAGVRYETAKETVNAVQVFTTPTSGAVTPTNLNRDYFLPAATLTYAIADRMQVRLNASKTIARPQFRELIFQTFYDPETNRNFRGNPLLVDSQLYNVEGRYEWYFAPEQRVSVAGFFKRIDNPIETFASFDDNSVVSSFANAPRANLYGGEFELTKYFNLDGLFNSEMFSTRRLVTVANYTYTRSRLKVRADDTTAVFAFSSTRALDFFRNDVPLTGQSDHLVNFQLGLEDRTRLSQQTLLLTYASDRVTNRGAGTQPDITERPGLRLDFVAREGVTFMGIDTELKFEVRNITGTRYQEFQQAGSNRIYYNRYDVGTSASIGLGLNF